MKSQIDALRQLTHELLYLGMDGEPIYADRFHQLNSEVYSQAETLYDKKTENDEEEATLCITLLKPIVLRFIIMGIKKKRFRRYWIVAGKFLENFRILY